MNATDGEEDGETEKEEDGDKSAGGLVEEQQAQEPAADATLPKSYPRLI